MYIDKGISEGNFIDVIYHYLLKEDMDRNEMEKLSRLALNLHKEYWYLCELSCGKKKTSQMDYE